MSKNNPRIIFPEGFDERDQYEMALRGCLSHAFVELENGERYAVNFIEPTRLAQDLTDYIESKIPCYAEPGLIVVPEVTLSSIQEAVNYLYDRDFFTQFKPVNS
jgi:hypothetical protein